MSTYVSPFTGNVIQPTDVSYYALLFTTDTQLFWPTVVNPTQVPAARIMDCAAASDGLVIMLPDATQGAVGSDILFRNLGAHDFTIVDAAGSESVSVPVGISKYVYLTSNTTLGGTWANVTFAAGTSYADAVTLQGAGLTTIDGKLATTQNIINVTSSPFYANDTARAATYSWNGGAGTFNLPNVSTLSSGWYVGFRNNGTGSLSIVPTTPALINGVSTIVANPGDSGFIFYDVSTGNFITVGLVAPNNVTFTSATYDVDTIVGSTFSLVAYAPIIQTYIAQTGTRTTSLLVTLPATTQIYILANNTNHANYNIQFVVSGSSQSPLVVTTGTIVTVLSDGNNLYPLVQNSATTFLAVNGVAAAPSFSFIGDTTSGMYLQNSGVLGLSANSVEMLNIDNSNILDPNVTVTGRLTAGLITGGSF
jgi:hypothetical protein